MISKTVLRWLTLTALVGLCLGVMVPATALADTEITACPTTITVPGVYFLKKNLTATGTNCIVVHSSNVAIDMKGHTITGDGSAFHDGITDTGTFVKSVAISHGKIEKFGDRGIYFHGSTCCTFPFDSGVITLEKIEVTDNKDDGIFILGPLNNITDIKANKNGAEGVEVHGGRNLFNKIQANDNTGEGLKVDFSRNTENQITADHNLKNGMELFGSRNSVSNSQANDNKFDGIDLDNERESVANVRTNRNGEDGIFIGDFQSRVTNATANNNGSSGIFFDDDEELVADSVANNNKATGISLGFGDGNTVTDVTANHNATGVKLSCSGGAGNAVNVKAHNNSVKNLSEINDPCTNLLNNAP